MFLAALISGSHDFQTFDQQGFAEAKAYKKPGKIYYFLTFRGHRDAIIYLLIVIYAYLVPFPICMLFN